MCVGVFGCSRFREELVLGVYKDVHGIRIPEYILKLQYFGPLA